MDPIASFSGLASGIDFRSLVDEIVRAEAAPVRRLQRRILEIQRKSGAYESFRSHLSRLEQAAEGLREGTAFRSFGTSVTSGGSSSSAVEASAGEEARPGSYEVSVERLARREKVGGTVFASRTEALGLSGELLVNGRAVRIEAGDSLEDVADAFDAVNSGTDASGVSATVLELGPDAHRLVLTADSTGADGVELADGEAGVLRSLGLHDGTVDLKHVTSDGAKSDAFVSASDPVASLLDLEQTPAAGAVDVGSFQATLDLASMSLQDIADEINARAADAGSSVTASVVESTDDDGRTVFELDVDGTTSFSDTNAILETLGVVEGGRSGVAQELESANAFAEADGTTPASASTLLVDLTQDGSSAGVQAGDTLDLHGTRADGTTFEKTFTVQSDSTLQDLLNALNSATDGYGAGSETSTASITADGRLAVVDDQAGSSELALSVVANNEGGGTLDFGEIETTVTGVSREIVAGEDARLSVDGTVFTRDTNVVDDIIAGVTLSLAETTDSPVTVQVEQDVDAAVEAVGGLVDAYNEIAGFVAEQFSGKGAEDGESTPPLSGDAILRQMSTRVRSAMASRIAPEVGGDVLRLADVGVEIERDGRFSFDEGTLRDRLAADPAAVERLFGLFGETSTGSLSYVTASDETASGTYGVEISQAAERAGVTGSGFGGTYVDDGTPDTLVVRDLSSNAEYSVSLADGDTLDDIVQALNAEFEDAQRQRLESGEVLYSDASGTAATSATALADLHDAGGTNLGVAAGDTITLSGTAHDGSSVYREYVVDDPATETLGSLEAAFQETLGADVEVTVSDGRLAVEALDEGGSFLDLTVTSDNAGGGTLSFGGMDEVRTGRGRADITASDDGGELRLEHGDYGSKEGFEISYEAGGGDGTGSLGLAAGTYTGVDVVGTIGGHEAEGRGRILVGAEDTEVEGLMIEYEAADTGQVGEVTFSRGVASVVEEQLEDFLGSGPATVDGVVRGLDDQVGRLQDRISRMEDRLASRRETLIRRFSALEEALAEADARGQFLAAQLGTLS